MNKKLLIVGAVVSAFVGWGVLKANTASAETTDEMPPFVQRLVERFNLNADEVKTVMQQDREEHRLQMQTSHEERLGQAVSDGVLTQEQKDALQAKWQERFEQRDQERQQHREEMDTWMEEQGIDHEKLMQYDGFAGRRMGAGMHRGW